jgi:hypothetical protein
MRAVGQRCLEPPGILPRPAPAGASGVYLSGGFGPWDDVRRGDCLVVPGGRASLVKLALRSALHL